VGAAIASAVVSAQAQTYAEVGFLAAAYEEDVAGSTAKSSPNALRAIIGRELSDRVAVEGLLSFGVGQGNVKLAGMKIDGGKLKLDSTLGVYLKGKVNVTDGLQAFARAGIVRVDTTANILGVKASSHDSGFSYGLGVSYALGKTTSVNFDYMSYSNKSAAKTTGFTLGVGYRF
jgi:opacity protein-like surface antigen